MIGIEGFIKRKQAREKISMITAYDYFSGKLIEQAGIDCILVGDSLGMVVKGCLNTLDVKIDEIIYHTKAVRRGTAKTFIIADMPYMSFHLNSDDTKRNAGRLIVEGGANAVKLEGGSASRIEMIRSIVDCEIPVVGHLGLTPQSISKLGEYKVQAREAQEASILLEQAKEIEQAAAFMLVLEAIPEHLAQEITKNLSIPTIGIGAGRYTDGQVLVINDIFRLSDMQAKFSKVYADINQEMLKGLREFQKEVKSEAFPRKENVYYPISDTE